MDNSETERNLEERKIELNKRFEWSDDNIKKILAFNDAVLLKYVEAYEKTEQVLKDIERLRKENGRTGIYDNYRIETEVVYCYPEGGTECADEETLAALEKFHFWSGNQIVVQYEKELDGFSIPFDSYDEYFLSDLSWNIELFNQSEFAKKKIAYFLHNLFVDGNYSLQDIVCMKAEDVKVFVKVELA